MYPIHLHRAKLLYIFMYPTNYIELNNNTLFRHLNIYHVSNSLT